jgi:hypothetical protein
VNELRLPDVLEAAARATINERCARAYMHDIRGSMQAVFSALELLGRSARSDTHNRLRIEKACSLAATAIDRHEKSTLAVMQLLTAQHAASAAVDLAELVGDVVHFLRNDAANREISIQLSTQGALPIAAERNTLHIVIVGLLTIAIDEAPDGSELTVQLSRRGDEAVLSISSEVGYADAPDPEELWRLPAIRLQPRELTLMFARRFLTANGGHMEFDLGTTRHGALHLYYPCTSLSGDGPCHPPLR